MSETHALAGAPAVTRRGVTLPPVERRAYSPDEAASALGVCRSTLENYLRGYDAAGRPVPQLAAVRVGRRVFIRSEALDDFLANLPAVRPVRGA